MLRQAIGGPPHERRIVLEIGLALRGRPPDGLEPLGADLLPLIKALERWAEQYFRSMEAHRAGFDAADAG